MQFLQNQNSIHPSPLFRAEVNVVQDIIPKNGEIYWEGGASNSERGHGQNANNIKQRRGCGLRAEKRDQPKVMNNSLAAACKLREFATIRFGIESPDAFGRLTKPDDCNKLFLKVGEVNSTSLIVSEVKHQFRRVVFYWLRAKVLLLSWLVVSSNLCGAQTFRVELISQPILNAPITASIYATGTVGVENSLRQISEGLTINGSQVLGLGTASSPGIYEFRFRVGDQSDWLIVPIFAEGISSKPKPVDLSRLEEDTLLRFLQLHTRRRCRDNWKKWPLGEHIGNRIVKVTTAGALIIACPFDGVACGPAAVEAVNLVFNFAIDFEMFQAHEFQKLGR